MSIQAIQNGVDNLMNSGKMKERQMPRKARNKRKQRRTETEQKYKQQAEEKKKERKGWIRKRRTRRELDEEKKTCRVEGRQSGQSAFRSPIERGGVGMSYTISGSTRRDERYTKPNED